jgi:hypothetical protein
LNDNNNNNNVNSSNQSVVVNFNPYELTSSNTASSSKESISSSGAASNGLSNGLSNCGTLMKPSLQLQHAYAPGFTQNTSATTTATSTTSSSSSSLSSLTTATTTTTTKKTTPPADANHSISPSMSCASTPIASPLPVSIWNTRYAGISSMTSFNDMQIMILEAVFLRLASQHHG